MIYFGFLIHLILFWNLSSRFRESWIFWEIKNSMFSIYVDIILYLLKLVLIWLEIYWTMLDGKVHTLLQYWLWISLKLLGHQFLFLNKWRLSCPCAVLSPIGTFSPVKPLGFGIIKHFIAHLSWIVSKNLMYLNKNVFRKLHNVGQPVIICNCVLSPF